MPHNSRPFDELRSGHRHYRDLSEEEQQALLAEASSIASHHNKLKYQQYQEYFWALIIIWLVVIGEYLAYATVTHQWTHHLAGMKGLTIGVFVAVDVALGFNMLANYLDGRRAHTKPGLIHDRQR